MREPDPLDLVESFARANDLAFEREEGEIQFSVSGQKSDYHVVFMWLPDARVLHMACMFDFKPPPHRINEVKELVARINERLWVGHFDLSLKDGVAMFRGGVPFPDFEPTPLQCQTMFQSALETCEEYYPAYQYVIWAGKSTAEALEAVEALSTVQGEA